VDTIKQILVLPLAIGYQWRYCWELVSYILG